MSARLRRRRAALLLALALTSGGFAAAEVRGRVGEIEARTGALVPVAVAATDLAPGTLLGSEETAGALEVRRVPAAYAPPDALADPASADGLRLAVPVAAGAYVTAGMLGGPDDEDAGGEPGLARGERAVEVAVAGAGGGAAGVAPGARVDVLVTSEDQRGGGRTYVALEDVEVLEIRDGGAPAADAPAGPRMLATLRVAAADAPFLVAAQSFAREIRLLARPPGDRRPLRGVPVTRGDV